MRACTSTWVAISGGTSKMTTIDKHVFEKAFRATTNPLRLMPDFIIIGAMRGGTTSLYSYLTENLNIAPRKMKKDIFFIVYFSKALTWFEDHFLWLAKNNN